MQPAASSINNSNPSVGHPSDRDDLQSLAFSEQTLTEDFKMKVCLPYFKDIYKDLCSRSDDK